MKHCKGELRFLPRRLMAMEQTKIHENGSTGHGITAFNELKILLDKKGFSEGILGMELNGLKMYIENEFILNNEDHELSIEKPNDNNLNELDGFLKKINKIKENDKKEGLIYIETIDDSLGEIKDLVIGYTPRFSPCTKHDKYKKIINAFNKIYADLVIKLSRINEGIPNTTALKLYPVARGLDPVYSNLKEINFAIEKLAYFTGSYVQKEEALSIRVANGVVRGNIWVQDDMIPVKKVFGGKKEKRMIFGKMKDKPKENLKEKNPKEEKNKRVLANIVAGFKCDRTASFILPSRFVGGNILFVGDCILVGKRSLLGLYAKKYTDKKIKEIFHVLFGKKKRIIIIGCEEFENPAADNEKYAWLDLRDNHQPLYHLDLFITPAGISKDTGKYRLVVGEPTKRIESDDSELLKDGMFEKTKSRLCKIVQQLECEGFEITRIPLPLSWVDLVNNVGKLKKIWVFASYNNCVVQYIGKDDPKNLVFLPRYSGNYKYEFADYRDGSNNILKYKNLRSHHGNCKDKKCVKCNYSNKSPLKGGDWSELHAYEDEVETHWVKLGFRPVYFTNYMPLLVFRGALRCMLKVVERGEYVAE